MAAVWLAALVATSGPTSPAVAGPPGPALQLAVLVDGSSSVSSQAFAQVQNALLAAVDSSTRSGAAIPADGSVELCVVQYASALPDGPARLELPPTLVTADSISAIIATIRSLSQAGGYTPAASGLTCAAESLLSSPHAAFSQARTILVVTDGLPDSLTEAVDAATAASERGITEIDAVLLGSDTDALGGLVEIVRPQPATVVGTGGYAPGFVAMADSSAVILDALAQVVLLGLDGQRLPDYRMSWQRNVLEIPLERDLSSTPTLLLDAADAAHIVYRAGPGTVRHMWQQQDGWHSDVIGTPFSIAAEVVAAIGPDDAIHLALVGADDASVWYGHLNGADLDLERVADALGPFGGYPAIALNDQSRPCISYYDHARAQLMLARRSAEGWTFEMVDDSGIAGRFSSIAVSAEGYVQIAYQNWGNDDLCFAERNATGWTLQTVDDQSVVGPRAMLSAGPDGETAIAYVDCEEEQLSVATRAADGWSSHSLDEKVSGQTRPSLRYGQDGRLHVAYARADGSLRYAVRDQRWTACTVGTEQACQSIPSLQIASAGTGVIARRCSDGTLDYLAETSVPSESWRVSRLPDISPSIAIQNHGESATLAVHDPLTTRFWTASYDSESWCIIETAGGILAGNAETVVLDASPEPLLVVVDGPRLTASRIGPAGITPLGNGLILPDAQTHQQTDTGADILLDAACTVNGELVVAVSHAGDDRVHIATWRDGGWMLRSTPDLGSPTALGVSTCAGSRAHVAALAADGTIRTARVDDGPVSPLTMIDGDYSAHALADVALGLEPRMALCGESGWQWAWHAGSDWVLADVNEMQSAVQQALAAVDSRGAIHLAYASRGGNTIDYLWRSSAGWSEYRIADSSAANAMALSVADNGDPMLAYWDAAGDRVLLASAAIEETSAPQFGDTAIALPLLVHSRSVATP